MGKARQRARYIENLIKNIVGRHRCVELREEKFAGNDALFVEHLSTELEVDEVGDMNPETLGKIMCSFEIGQLYATNQDLIAPLNFTGDGEELLRQLVSRALACSVLGFLIGGPKYA